MPAVTIIKSNGQTFATPAQGVVGSIYLTGEPNFFVGVDFSPQQPGGYIGLYILQTLTGPDGNAWYRWDSDSPLPVALVENNPRPFVLTYAPGGA